MKLAALVLAAIAVAACQPAEEPESSSPAAGIVAGSITSAAELAGWYRVGGIDGDDLADSSEGFAVVITENRISIDARCVHSEWAYRFVEGVLETERDDDFREPCRRVLNRFERALAGAFDGPLSVNRTPANGILFENQGGTLTLFSQ